MCRIGKRTALAACLTIGTALAILTPVARADRDSSREGRDGGHSRWGHGRRHERSSSREQARESHRRGGNQANDGRRGHRGHHEMARAERASAISRPRGTFRKPGTGARTGRGSRSRRQGTSPIRRSWPSRWLGSPWMDDGSSWSRRVARAGHGPSSRRHASRYSQERRA